MATGIKSTTTEKQQLIERYKFELKNADVGDKETEYAADKLDYIAQNIIRERQKEEARNRSREEWTDLEARHVYTVTSNKALTENIEMLQLFGEISDKQAEWARNRLRECNAWNCDSYFVPRDKRGRYCSGKCKTEQRQAIERFKLYGTYLPRDVYIDKRPDSIQEAISKHEVSLTDEMLERIDEHGEFITQGERKEQPYFQGMDEEIKSVEKVNECSPIERKNTGGKPRIYEEGYKLASEQEREVIFL